MLLTIDLGNTSAKFAIFDGDQQICFLNIDSKQDDYTAIIKNFLYRNNLKEDLIEDVIISSVVPNISKVLEKVILNVFNKEAIFISPTNDYGIKIETENVEEVGSDLLVMCAYAYHLFKQELLVVSLGTASVICHVDNEGSFKHCIISPGYGKSLRHAFNSLRQTGFFGIIQFIFCFLCWHIGQYNVVADVRIYLL